MMKDKLVKTGHGKAYYRARSLLLVLGLFAASTTAFALPVVLAGHNERRAQPIHAEPATSEPSAAPSSEEQPVHSVSSYE